MKSNEVQFIQTILPEYPRIAHFPILVGALDTDDVIAQRTVLDELCNASYPQVLIQEKIDGANCGMAYDGEQAYLRNRNHILGKGYPKQGRTPAAQQFVPAWNWIYDHRQAFEYLNEYFGETVGVFGEWVYAVHGIRYNTLPNPFIAFDIWIPSKQSFHQASDAHRLLSPFGFDIPETIYWGNLSKNPDVFQAELAQLLDRPSHYRDGAPEGMVLRNETNRYKIVRPEYVSGALWNKRQLTKQVIQKGE